MIKIGSVSVLLGLFDGLHRGHMSAVGVLTQSPGERVVYTFGALGMDTKGDRKLLMSDLEKRDMLLKAGVDRVISEDFSKVKNISAADFVKDVLCDRLHAARVVAGENFKFGAGGHAGAAELENLCRALDIEPVIVPTVYDHGEPISTTRIRGLLEHGEIASANALLGREYSMIGKSIDGYIYLPEERVIPEPGNYLVKISGEEAVIKIFTEKEGAEIISQKIPNGEAEITFSDRIS